MLLGAVLKSVLIYERYFWSYLLTVTYIENFKLAEKELYGIRCYIFTSEIRKPVLAVSVYLMKKKTDVLAFWLFVCLFLSLEVCQVILHIFVLTLILCDEET